MPKKWPRNLGDPGDRYGYEVRRSEFGGPKGYNITDRYNLTPNGRAIIAHTHKREHAKYVTKALNKLWRDENG